MIALILLSLAGAFKAIADTLVFHWSSSVFKNLPEQQWNALKSWRNKYKNGDPDQGPAFPGSTTIFVALTDWWHRFDLLRIICGVLAVAFAPAWAWWLTALLGLAVFLAAFNAVYYLLYKK